MANITSINGNPIVLDPVAARGTISNEMLVQSNGILSEFDYFKTYIGKMLSTLVDGEYTLVKGYYDKNNGTFWNTTGKTTGIIPVESGDIFCLSGSYYQNTSLITEFDENDAFLRSKLSTTGAYETVSDYIYIVPSDVSSVAFSSYPDSAPPLRIKKPTEEAKELAYIIDLLMKSTKTNVSGTVNITSDANIQRGGYLGKLYGSIVSDNNSYHTDFIPVSEGDTILFSGTTQYSVAGCCVYDKSKGFISSHLYDGTNKVDYTDEPFVIQSGVKYVRFSSYTVPPTIKLVSNSLPINKAIVTDRNNGNVLNGKKLVTAGDSYTQASYSGDYAEYNGKNYGYYVAERNNMDFVNMGISGSIMALDSTYVDDPDNVPINTRQPFSYQRYLNVPADTDYLTIWFGINDASHTDLGTINDETNETFYGAWNVVMRYFLTNYPFMKIGLIVTTGAGTSYRQAVRDIAEKWGYPYLDWVNDKQIPAFFDRQGMSTEAQSLRRDAYGYNDFSGHPSPEWHEYASTIYENFLRSL